MTRGFTLFELVLVLSPDRRHHIRGHPGRGAGTRPFGGSRRGVGARFGIGRCATSVASLAASDRDPFRHGGGIGSGARRRRHALASRAARALLGVARRHSRFDRLLSDGTRVRGGEHATDRRAWRVRRDGHGLTCGEGQTMTRRELLLYVGSATVPKSKPGIEMRSIGFPNTRSMVRTIAISSGAMKVKASPVDDGAPGAADAMDIILSLPRHVVVDDVGNAGDIEPSLRDVGGDEHANFTELEPLDWAWVRCACDLSACIAVASTPARVQVRGRRDPRRAWCGVKTRTQSIWVCGAIRRGGRSSGCAARGKRRARTVLAARRATPTWTTTGPTQVLTGERLDFGGHGHAERERFVVRERSRSTMRLICGAKPMSSMRSASSSTRISSDSKRGVALLHVIDEAARVATMTSTPRWSACSCGS